MATKNRHAPDIVTELPGLTLRVWNSEDGGTITEMDYKEPHKVVDDDGLTSVYDNVFQFRQPRPQEEREACLPEFPFKVMVTGRNIVNGKVYKLYEALSR